MTCGYAVAGMSMLFPALRAIVSSEEYSALGEDFDGTDARQ